MSAFLYIHGEGFYFVRVGFAGQRPLIYAIYCIGANTTDLPIVAGQTYRAITRSQYEWLKRHLCCDVSYIEADWGACTLECRTHREFYHLFDEPLAFDPWFEREV
jgi:hypothetical protein